jgi:hypothetical protein
MTPCCIYFFTERRRLVPTPYISHLYVGGPWRATLVCMWQKAASVYSIYIPCSAQHHITCFCVTVSLLHKRLRMRYPTRLIFQFGKGRKANLVQTFCISVFIFFKGKSLDQVATKKFGRFHFRKTKSLSMMNNSDNPTETQSTNVSSGKEEDEAQQPFTFYILLWKIWDIITAKFDTSQPPCTHSLWPNIVVAGSNWLLTGIPAIIQTWTFGYRRYICIAAVISSTIYHLSEIKSRLPGVPYLRNYAFWLMQIDRLCAVAAMADVVITMYIHQAVNWWVVVVAILGLGCGIMSEFHIGWIYVIWHSLWHNAAFLALFLV